MIPLQEYLYIQAPALPLLYVYHSSELYIHVCSRSINQTEQWVTDTPKKIKGLLAFVILKSLRWMAISLGTSFTHLCWIKWVHFWFRLGCSIAYFLAILLLIGKHFFIYEVIALSHYPWEAWKNDDIGLENCASLTLLFLVYGYE